MYKRIIILLIMFVILTANAITGMREQYLEKGFDEYLSKPIEREKLDEILERFLK